MYMVFHQIGLAMNVDKPVIVCKVKSLVLPVLGTSWLFRSSAPLLPFSGANERTKILKMGRDQYFYVHFPRFLIFLLNNFLTIYGFYAL